MWADEVLEHVRAVREELAAKFGFDLRAMVADVQKRERESGRVLLEPPPKPDFGGTSQSHDPPSEEAVSAA